MASVRVLCRGSSSQSHGPLILLGGRGPGPESVADGHALALVHRGEFAEAEALARAAVDICAATDDINMQRDCFVRLADVLAAAGRAQGAEAALHEALAPYERKSNVVTG